MDIEYFHNWESDNFYACVGTMAEAGIFVLRDPRAGRRGVLAPLIGRLLGRPRHDRSAPEARWELLPPHSPDWDSTAQKIYVNSRVDKITPDQLPSSSPRLPELPSGPFPRWRDYFLPGEPLKAAAFPSVASALRLRPDPVLDVCVVLFEDLYESRQGDGEFHYLRATFLDEEEAERSIAEHQTDGTRFHLRRLTMRLAEDSFEFPDFEPMVFDHYGPHEVLEHLEASLRQGHVHL